MTEQLRAPDSSSGVFDQQSVGSSPGRETCVLVSLGGTTGPRTDVHVLGLVVHIKQIGTFIAK